MEWLLLLHQIPPTPAYLRAKAMRRLNQLGALAIKNSAYVLPATDEMLEDFQWLRREIEQGGGAAWVFRCDSVGGLSDDQIREQFRNLRAPEFAELAQEAHALLERTRAAEAAPGDLRKLRRRFDELRQIDYFQAPGREDVEALMQEIERIQKIADSPANTAVQDEFKARTWVTRKGVKVDRMASAWLIRRFLDPAARFRFVDLRQYRHQEGELRFDMFEGEFTHQGDQCTFEVLLRLLPSPDPGLAAIAEVIHDIDLKESKFQRPETAGVSMLIDGIALRNADDQRRLEEGATLFDALYARMGAAS